MKEIKFQLNNHQARIVLLQKIIIANALWQDNYSELKTINEVLSMSIKERENFLINDVKCESYKMLVINYLIALLGMKKNDTISFYNDSNDHIKELVKNFHEEHEIEFKALRTVRNKFYSHYENNYDIKLKINNDFINTCIYFSNHLLKIEKELNKQKEI